MAKTKNEDNADQLDDAFLTTSIGLMSRDLYRAMSRAIDAHVARFGLAAYTCRYLAVMRSYPDGITPKDLSDYLRVSSPTTVVALKTLESKGLIARSADATDKRKSLYRLTPQGRDVEQVVRQCALEVEHKAIAHLSGTQVAAFREMVVVIRRSLEMQLMAPVEP